MRTFTPDEAAKKLGVSRQYVYDLIRTKQLPATREGAEDSIKTKLPIRIKEADLNDFIAKKKAQKAAMVAA